MGKESNFEVKDSITLEVVDTLIRGTYFDYNGDCLVEVTVLFKSDGNRHAVTRTIKINADDAWGLTLEERSKLIGRNTFNKTDILSEEK